MGLWNPRARASYMGTAPEETPNGRYHLDVLPQLRYLILSIGIWKLKRLAAPEGTLIYFSKI